MLFIGFGWYPEHIGAFFASVAAFYVLLYVAGGGRLPWKIKFRDYLAYVLISVGIVGLAHLIALYEAHKGQ